MHLKTKISTLFESSEWDESMTVFENLDKKSLTLKYIAVIYKNHYCSLNETIPYDETILFIQTGSFTARKILEKTLSFIVGSIIKKIDPRLKPVITHVINNGLYCLVEGEPITPDFLNKIEKANLIC